ncbi:hypothetical protein ABH931_002349 [Streptacidiphilus sp. MAP12-33]
MVSARRSAFCPSVSSDSTASGNGGTTLTQTIQRSASGGAARRVMMLESPNAAAAPTTRANAPNGAEPPREAWSSAATAIPATATASPASLRAPILSRSNAAAKPAVNTAWPCCTSELRPGGMPAFIPSKSSPNCSAPSTSPPART